MTNIFSTLRHLTTIAEVLVEHDVTILSISIERNKESEAACFRIQCRMDEWFMTWAVQYYRHRAKFTENFDQEYVLFPDGKVFALYDPEDK